MTRKQSHGVRRIIAALAIAPLLAAPAVAAGKGRPTRSQAKAEREATRQLNLQAANEAQQRNVAAHPAPAASDAAAHAPDNTPPAAAPTAPVQVQPSPRP
jgi:hypothetical protein